MKADPLSRAAFNETIAKESDITTPKSASKALTQQSPRFNSTLVGKLSGVEMFSVKQPKDQSDDNFEQVSSDEDFLANQNYFSGRETGDKVNNPNIIEQQNSVRSECTVQETPFQQRKEPSTFIKVQAAQRKQRRHVGILKFKPKSTRPSRHQARIDEDEDLNETLHQSQSHESQVMTEVQEETYSRNINHIRNAYIQTPTSTHLGIVIPNRAKTQYFLQQVKAKETQDQSILDQASATKTANYEQNQGVQPGLIPTETVCPANFLQATVRQPQSQQDCNMVLTDEENEKRTKYLLTRSRALDCGEDYFVNIETATEMFDSVKPADNAYFSEKRAESFKAVNSNLKMIHLGNLALSLRIIDLQYNKLRSLPDEISTLAALTDLKVDHNLLHRLPKQFWRLKALRELTLSHNRISQLPENFHWLQALEVLKLDHNRLVSVPDNIGVLISLRKLYLHENRIAHLPRELSNLNNLIEFSIEWFIYTKPSNSKIQRSAEVIKSIKDFCQVFQFRSISQIPKVYRPFCIPKHEQIIEAKDESHSEDCLASQLSSHSSIRKRPINSTKVVQQPKPPIISEPSFDQHMLKRSKYVSFTDFLLHFHKVPHNDVCKLNELEFTAKKRSIVHHLCSNLHLHLLANLLGHLPEKLTSQDVSTAAEHVGKVIDLNRRDIQGVVPACMLVMNFSIEQQVEHDAKGASEERLCDDFLINEDSQSQNQHSQPINQSLSKQRLPHQKYFHQKDQEVQAVLNSNTISTPGELGCSDSSFIDSDDSDNTLTANRTKRIKEKMLYFMLNAKDHCGNPMVSLNDDILDVPDEHPFFVVNKPRFDRQDDGMKASVVTVKEDIGNKVVPVTQFIQNKRPKEQTQQQHNILFWAVFKYRFDIAYDLIAKYGADCNIVNSNGASLLHILFANFDKDRLNAEKLSNLMINEHGLDVNLQDTDGKSALHVAIGKQQQLAVDYAHLFNYRAKFGKPSRNTFDFELPDIHGKTALHYAIKKSNYPAFALIIKNQVGSCFHRDFELKTPRQNTFINTAFYRILIREEINHVARLIRSAEIQDTGEQRDGAITRCKQDNLENFQKEFQSVMTAFDTVRTNGATKLQQQSNHEASLVKKVGGPSPFSQRVSQSVTFDQENVNDTTDDMIQICFAPINTPNTSQAFNIQLQQREDKFIPQIDGRYPMFQLGLMATKQSKQNMVLHEMMSLRSLPNEKKEKLLVNQPNQFEFTLGQPLAPQFFVNDFLGQTERNSDISPEKLKRGTSFELLVKQDVNRPVLKGPTEQVAQKTFDMGQSLGWQVTDDIKTDAKLALHQSLDSWMVLGSTCQRYEEDEPQHEVYSGIRVEELENLGILRPKRAQQHYEESQEIQRVIKEGHQKLSSEELGARSPCFNEASTEKAQKQFSKQVKNAKTETSNIFISNLSININYNININLSQGQQLDPDLARQISQFQQLTRSPSKPQLKQTKIPNKIVPEVKRDREDSLDEITKVKQSSFMTNEGEENVEASFRSLLGFNGTAQRQPHSLLNKLSQPNLEAVTHQHTKGANIYIDNLELNGDEHYLKASPELSGKKLMSGYGIEDTVHRDRRQDLQGKHTLTKHLYQSCDVQAESIDCTQMGGLNSGLHSKMSQRDLFAAYRCGNTKDISENLESQFTGKKFKPIQIAERSREPDTLYLRNQEQEQKIKASFSDLCAEQRQRDFILKDQEHSFRDCNLSEISNSPRGEDQRKHLVNEYQLALREIPYFNQKRHTCETIQSSNALAVVGYDETAQDDHQVTVQSLTCISDTRSTGKRQPCSFKQTNALQEAIKRFPLVEGNLSKGTDHLNYNQKEPNQKRSQILQNAGQEYKQVRNNSREELDFGFATVLATEGPKVFQRSRSGLDSVDVDFQIQKVSESLKGNEFLPEFKILVDRTVPEWHKFDLLFNRLAGVLLVCSTRIQSTKRIPRQEQLVRVSSDKRRKDALICLKVLADLLSSEQSALYGEVVHLISKHNIVKARSGLIGNLQETTESRRQIKFSYKLADEPIHSGICSQSRVSEVSAVNHLYSQHEACNAKAINETYKKIQMDKFPTVSHKLGKFLKDKKDSEKVKRSQSISSDHRNSQSRILKIATQTSGPIPIQQRHRVFTRESFVFPKPVNEPRLEDYLVTPRMTFASEQDVKKVTVKPTKRFSDVQSMQIGQQKSVVLASQMNRLNEASNIFKLKPAGK